MSHFIDTPQASYGGSSGLSNRQRWEIFAGVVVAVALGVAAIAFVNNTESLIADQTVQPLAQSYAAVDDLATRTAVPAQGLAGADDLATRPAVPAQSLAASDDLATRIVVVEAQSYAGSDDVATRPATQAVQVAVPLAGSDDLATRIVIRGAVRHAAIDDESTRLTGPRYAGSDDLAIR